MYHRMLSYRLVVTIEILVPLTQKGEGGVIELFQLATLSSLDFVLLSLVPEPNCLGCDAFQLTLCSRAIGSFRPFGLVISARANG